jgi:hypothetical protein
VLAEITTVRRRSWWREIVDTPFATLLLASSIVFSAYLFPKLGSELVFTDLLIAGTIVASMLHLFRGDWLARDVRHAIAVPVLLIIIGSLIGSLYAGLRSWIISDLVLDAATLLVFLAAVDILRRGGPRAVRFCYGALGIAIVLGAIQLAASGGDELRASGTFPNPNVAANLLAMGVLCWSASPFRPAVKVSVIGVAVVGLMSAASFGSMLQLGVGFGYIGLSHVDRARDLMRGRRLLAVIPLVIVALIGVFVFSQLRGGQEKSGFNSARFDRSGGLRVEVWQEAIRRLPDAPFGVGPGSVRGLDLNSLETELHSEPLAYLVERGVIGLAGLFLMWFVLLRITPRGSAARAMVIAYILGSFFRETWHYRHFWLFLPLALVMAEQQRRASAAVVAEYA